MQGIISLIVVVAILASVEAFVPFTSRVAVRTQLKAATDGVLSWSSTYNIQDKHCQKNSSVSHMLHYRRLFRDSYHREDG